MSEAIESPAPPPDVVPAAPHAPLATDRRHDRYAVALLIALATLLFIDVLAGTSNFYMRDLTRYYYPTKQILREVVLGGEFPYWNRYFHAGQPIAANPEHEVFYPLTWLILLPSYDLGYRLHILIHIYIGLLGMYALLRSMELRPYVAFIGAITWGAGGLYLSYVNLLPILFCVAWLPLTCLYVRRFLLVPRARDFALASLFLGIQFLVGEPTTIMQTGLLLGCYALYRGWYSRPRFRGSARAVAIVGAISLCALLVGAAQVLPAIDHVHDSARSRAFGFDLVSTWSMPWAKLAEVIYPNVLGHIAIKRVMWYWGGGLYPGMGSPFLFNIYNGLLVIALAIGSVFARPRGGRFVLMVVTVSLLLALGSHTPLLRWLYDAGIARAIRYPEKFALIAGFTVILFAAQMLERLLSGDDSVRDGAFGFLLAVLLVAVTLAILAFTPHYARTFPKMWNMTGATARRVVEISRQDWIVAAIRAACATALLLTVRVRFRRTWLTAFALFVVVDLATVTAQINPRMPRRFFSDPPLASRLPVNRASFRVFHEADWYGQEETAKKFFSTGEAVYWVVRNGLYPMTPAGAAIPTVLERDYDKTSLLPTIDLTDSVWDLKRAGRTDWYQPFMAMSNAWYRAIYRSFEDEKKRARDLKTLQPIQFLESEHSPRYYFADQLVTIRDRHDFVKKLTKNTYSGRVAFVTRGAFVPGAGSVLRATETANTATIDVQSRGRGFLVMSVTPHKYWRVAIDGRPVESRVTNIGYQGVAVPPGSHRVSMRYVNPLVGIGSGVSVAAVVSLAAVAAFSGRGLKSLRATPA